MRYPTVASAVRRQQEVIKAQGELVAELTAHADALRDALLDYMATDSPDVVLVAERVIEAYDNFMKEC